MLPASRPGPRDTPLIRSLVVDDSVPDCRALCELIERHFPEIIVLDKAHDLRTATRCIAHEHPELIFLELQLGGDSGLTLLDGYHRPRPFHVVFVSSHNVRPADLIGRGALRFILKPVDKNSLHNALTRYHQRVALYTHIRPAHAGTGTHNGTSRLIHDFHRMVEKHFYTHHEVEFYAHELHVSYDSLLRAVKAELHMTPHQFIEQRMVYEAKRLLLRGKRVGEMAYDLGYTDRGNFVKCFRRVEGMPPSAWLAEINGHRSARNRHTFARNRHTGKGEAG